MSKPLDPIKPVNIHIIRIDGGTQSRAAINQEVVAEYAAALADGDYLPEIIVFFDGVDYWLGDGFHRLHAHLSLQKASIVAEIRKGTQRDAILFSLKANVVHGLRPNNEDKRKAVLTMLDDPEWCEMKDRAIGRHCGCSHMTVARIRASLAESETPEIGTSAKPKAAEPEQEIGTSAKKVEPEAVEPPDYTELEAARDLISDLQSELVVARMGDIPEDEKQQASALITELRAEVQTLTATLKAAYLSRDSLMEENAQMKRQLQMQRKDIDKLKNNH